MKMYAKWFGGKVAIVAGSLALVCSCLGDTTIAVFDENFHLDGLFAWSDAIVVATANGYSITDTNYGSGYKDINPNIDASGETNIELTVTISAPDATPGGPASGPIVALVDQDGTFVNYAWYGQTVGTHVLNAALSSGSVQGSGTVPGLDLSRLDFFHLQDDPGAYHGQYTIVFQKLRLTGYPGPKITEESYDSTSKDFNLTWTSRGARNYSIQHTPNLSNSFTNLVMDIPSGGTTTSTTVNVPAGSAGFLRVVEQ